MKLLRHLVLVASFVNGGSSLADTETDHGCTPTAPTWQRRVTRVIAMDMRKGPLEQAGEYIREYYLEERIETRLSDGTERLKVGEADMVVIAGTGGEMVIHIPEGGRHLWDEVGQWVLSPRLELNKVRTYLQENGFVITREDMVGEDGRYYIIMDVSRGVMKEMSQAEHLYGACLIWYKNPVLREFLKRERDRLLKVGEQLNAQSTDSAEACLAEPIRGLDWNREA